jgi:crotonobetaine/carnitine-CoA ligase
VIAALLEAAAADAGERPFIVTDGAAHTYGAVALSARRFAAELAGRGIVRGDHVALIADNSAAFVVAWFACAAVGAVAVTLNTQLVGDGLSYALRRSDAKLIVADRAWIDAKFAAVAADGLALPLVPIEGEADFLARLAGGREHEPVAVSADEPFTILFTSGTTGRPKGVVNGHGAYVATGRATVKALGLGPDDRIMAFLPFFHVNPQMMAVMPALCARASVALRPRFSAAAFFDDARRFGATGFTYVGTVLSILTARHRDEQRDHRMRFCYGGGAPLDVWTAIEQRFGVRVYEAWGMTEAGCVTTANTVDDYRFGTCGRAREDIEVRIFDADDREVPPGTPGEIVVRPRRPGVILSGYYNQPDVYVASIRNLWFHTGDCGSLDADGYLSFHGRYKELIRRGGEMVSPVEIETVLRTMPGVSDCAVVGVADAIMGEEIKAAIVAEPGVDAPAVRAFLTGRIAPFMLPRYVEVVTAIPKTETEKIQRHKLQYLDERVHDLAAPSSSRP